MRKVSLPRMIVFSAAVHGLLLAAFGLGLRSLVVSGDAEEVIAVITAEIYGKESPRPEPAGAAVPAAAQRETPVKKKKPPRQAAGGTLAAALPRDDGALMDGAAPLDGGSTQAPAPAAGGAGEPPVAEEQAPKASIGGPAPAKPHAVSGGILSAISSAVRKEVVYPPVARKNGLEGTVLVSFRIAKDGSALDIHVAESSGSGILDEAAVEAVKKGTDYPSVDQPVIVPVHFKLKP
jgi:protein TonB